MHSKRQALAHRLAQINPPADAIECEPWVWHADTWRRLFLVKEWNIGGLWVSVAGEQTHDGTVRRWMHVGGEDECTSSDRRTLIAALVEAGHLLDSLTLHRVS